MSRLFLSCINLVGNHNDVVPNALSITFPAGSRLHLLLLACATISPIGTVASYICQHSCSFSHSVCWFRVLQPHSPIHISTTFGPTMQIVKVACGSSTVYALTDGGDIYAWGQGGRGELGTGGASKWASTPVKLPWACRVTSVAASSGGRFAAAIDQQGKLYTWGDGRWQFVFLFVLFWLMTWL